MTRQIGMLLYNLVEYTKRSVRYECCLRDHALYAEPEELAKYKSISFDQIKKDLINYYTNYYQINVSIIQIGSLKTSIQKAINDIQQYDEALGLTGILKQTRQTAYTYDLPKTPAGMIKTFRSYCQYAEKLIGYGEKVITRAEDELKALVDTRNRK